ncbi:MAG: hypothetical protein IT429_18885 [Gemmataceae bacterium]|nr:hypothetical protein [Gemmataceae bacterium]
MPRSFVTLGAALVLPLAVGSASAQQPILRPVQRSLKPQPIQLRPATGLSQPGLSSDGLLAPFGARGSIDVLGGNTKGNGSLNGRNQSPFAGAAPGGFGYGGSSPYGGFGPYANPFAGMNPYGGMYPYGGLPFAGMNPYGGMYPYGGFPPYGGMYPYGGISPFGAMPPYGAVSPFGAFNPYGGMGVPFGGATPGFPGLGGAAPVVGF